MPHVTIIVCTRNRGRSLAATLESIEAAIRDAPEVATEVVLVDNASTDDTQEVIRRWAEASPFPVITVFEARPGLSAARNAAVRAAAGEILAFTDDDCVLNPDYLHDLERHYAQDAGPVVRGGRVELGDPADLPFSIKCDDKPARMAELTYPGGFIIGANMTMRRDVVDRIGLFDERFGAGAPFRAGEDTDYIYRAYRAGIPVEYVPDMAVRHFHGRRTRQAIARLNHGYQVGGGALYAKHIRDRLLLRHFYWDCKKTLRAICSGHNSYNPALGLTYAAMIAANLKGMALFGIEMLRSGPRRPGKHREHAG